MRIVVKNKAMVTGDGDSREVVVVVDTQMVVKDFANVINVIGKITYLIIIGKSMEN